MSFSSFHVFLVRQYLNSTLSIPGRLGVLFGFILSLVSAIPTNKDNQVISCVVWQGEGNHTLCPLKIAVYREGELCKAVVPVGLCGNNGINQLQVAHKVKENIGKYAKSGGI